MLPSLRKFIDDIVCQILSGFIYFSGGVLLYIVFFQGILYYYNYTSPELSDSYPLGKGIYMIHRDLVGNVIVKGTGIKGRKCYAGLELIPTNVQCAKRDSTNEDVLDVNFDSDWIIVKTRVHDKKNHKFYIVSKADIKIQTTADEIINNYICGFSDSLQFAKACKEKRIKLKFE